MTRLLPTILLSLAVGGSGCSEDPAPKQKPTGNAAVGIGVLTKGSAAAPPPGATPGGAPPPPPPPAESTEAPDEDIAYVYSPIGKRDPFRSLFDVLQRSTDSDQLTELQKFELDQLRLVGIVSRIATPYAMVEDPSGKGHTLTRGKLIGKNWGRVSQITPDCVVVKEEYRDYTGRKVTNKTEMCIPKPTELESE